MYNLKKGKLDIGENMKIAEKSFVKKIVSFFNNLEINKNPKNYAVFFGAFTALFISIKELISYFLIEESSLIIHEYFLIVSLLLLVFAVIFILVLLEIIDKASKSINLLLLIYPFVLAVMANFIFYIYQNNSLKMFSYILSVIILSFAQIYKRNRRIALFSFSFGMFLIMYSFLYSSYENYINFTIIALVINIISYIIASTYYSMYKNKEKAISFLDQKSNEQKNIIYKLEQTYNDLLISHKITEKMLEITEEILKNENLEDVLQLVLEQAIKVVPKSQAGSILIDKNGKMDYVAAIGYDLAKLKKIELEFDDLFQSTLEDKYDPIIIKNLEVFDEFHLSKSKMDSFKKQKVNMAKSCLTCSFQSEGKFFGSINLDNFESEDIYNEQDKYFIKQLTKEIEIIISIHKLYEKALRPTKYDELTNAYTRKYGLKLLQNMLEKYFDSMHSICFIDINDLKKINDKYGHAVGDSYLNFFGESVLKSDIKQNIFSRLGGDEFLLVFKNTDRSEAETEIEKLRNYFKQNQFVFEKFKNPLTFSVGISVYLEDEKSIFELIKIADKRMYLDKNKN